MANCDSVSVFCEYCVLLFLFHTEFHESIWFLTSHFRTAAPSQKGSPAGAELLGFALDPWQRGGQLKTAGPLFLFLFFLLTFEKELELGAQGARSPQPGFVAMCGFLPRKRHQKENSPLLELCRKRSLEYAFYNV